MNRTLMDAIRANMLSAGLSNKYWTYACNYVVSLLNNAIVNKRIGDSPESYLRQRIGQGDFKTSYESSCFD
ncbi:unnamed protein product [Ambrosiozyma monospora]|uniref:Unnamed protein product n=1 Tax=Ambrosiozyma monospora TaxID=43982 RepID=A0ACB5SRG0_AMBMO|nr:unnamed protein product [Ambrosiozyma monospora]